MKRRDFFKKVSPVLALPVMIGATPLRAIARSPVLDPIFSALAGTDRVLVLIQLNGGNDGINTIVPLDQMSVYNSVRPDVALPESKVLKLSNSVGIHPAMADVKNMFDNGQVGVVQGVSYPNPNQSHFRATDIWMSGSEYDQYLSSGWAGRYLTTEYPNYPEGYPNTSMPDPPAIQIGGGLSLTFMGATGNATGIALQDPQKFYDIISGKATGQFAEPPNTKPGNELRYLRQIESESQVYSTGIKAAADKAANLVTYPTSNSLADSLKVVARLIAGGLKTKVYMVSLGGFDTHANQVETADHTQGSHALLLNKISTAVKAFYDDLTQLKVQDRVLSMTFSEFGRRVNSNASIGTDHGTSAPLFVFGTSVNPTIHGVNPSLTDLTNQNLKMQFDYRQVYGSIVAQWLGASQANVQKTVLKDFTQIPIIKSSAVSVEEFNTAEFQLSNYPNPVNESGTTISYNLPQACEVRLSITDLNGRAITTLVQEYQAAGNKTVHLNASKLPSGTYMYQLRAGRKSAVAQMVVQH